MTPQPVRIDRATRQAWHGEQLLTLARLEYDLLALLVARAGTVVTRAQVMRDVWGTDWIGGTKTMDQHIGWLRKKLGDDATNPAYITTLRGTGWIFHPEVVDGAVCPDPESLDLATTLRKTLAELDARIEDRAAELALVRVANAEQQAAERIAAAEAARQRQEDLVIELERQVRALRQSREQRLPTSQGTYVTH